uniref:DNA-directed RNA polymerase subunit n=1 Tax=Physcomitrium patens TaxID=3218 RepID=A0A7I4B1E4_PHYPA
MQIKSEDWTWTPGNVPIPPPPSAEIVGLQFGLTTANEIVGFSVQNRARDTLSSLIDPRLGLPAENERCATCSGTNINECTGHFGHLKLTQPIFHPHHVRLLQQVLSKICLACGSLKGKKKKLIFSEDEAKATCNWKQSSPNSDSVYSLRDNDYLDFPEAEPVKKDSDGDMVSISSVEEDFTRDILQVVPHGPVDFRIDSTSTQCTVAHLPLLGSNKSTGKGQGNRSAHIEATTSASLKHSPLLKSGSSKNFGRNPVKICKGSPAGLDVLSADILRQVEFPKKSTCVHCSPAYPDYKPILVKILPVKGRKKNDISQILMLEAQIPEKQKDNELPLDYWAFLQSAPARHQHYYKVPKQHYLLPSEALAILKKIPEGAIGKLGMNRLVARPEGLIMKCVLIPPNCTRTTDYKHVNNTTAVRFGTDNVTRTLQKLVAEIVHIRKTRAGKATNRTQRDESTKLQILTAEYLREKGAPKAVPGKEPLKRDRNGRVTKQDYHRWTKEWLSQNVLGKSGNFTAKAVLAGDPFLGIEQIGIPWLIAQKLTLPERASQWNHTKLQEYVNVSQKLQQESENTAHATRVERNEVVYQVLSKTSLKVQIGDIVHRHIQDGDYVYVNRPPSVHRHSLVALKVHIHHQPTITVNPLICPPFSADFDGDIFHIFAPQSLQAIAELDQLMAVKQQVISEHGGQPLLELTQDTLLAAHLLTSKKLFLDKATMDQLCLWASKKPPEAAILKSPKGGPFWTGEQVFALTLPEDFELGAPQEEVFIQGGEIIRWRNGTKLLRKGNDSVAAALCVQLGPVALVDYLNTATGVLHTWLQVQGFSTGLTDFQVTPNRTKRQEMLKSILEESFLKSIQESCDFVRILDAKVQALDSDENPSPESLTKNIRFLEQVAREIFQKRRSEAGRIVAKYAEQRNSLLMMVESGSKGSMEKLLQQIAGMGLQLYKGQHLLSYSSSRRPAMTYSSQLDWWEDMGLVRSSLVDGLKANELFRHVIADRTGILRKHVEVVQPGTLFKALMFFLRDLHIMYDGSVRSQCSKNLIQFCYGGARGSLIPRKPTEETLAWEEDDHRRWPLSVLAGEPVGVLAAAAISQPAYELMLDAPSLNGPFKPRPLNLIQETLYPREKSSLKPTDRCVVLRLVHCECTESLCLERRVLEVQAHLKRINLRMMAESVAVEYWNMEDSRAAGPSGDLVRLGSPWLGHINLSQDAMKQCEVNVEDIVKRLCQKFSQTAGYVLKKNKMGQIFFCHSYNCSFSNGYCLHFSPSLPIKMRHCSNEDRYNKALLDLLLRIQETIIPGLLDCTMKGDERIETVRVVCEGPASTTWHRRFAHCTGNLDEELVLEVYVSPSSSKSRGMAWASVKQACVSLKDLVDWNRSMPYSIQEIRCSLGIEVAYQIVVQRLGLVLEKTAPHTHFVHVKLVAEMMTFSGDAIGFTFSGFKDMNRSISVSAPFSEASFQQPIRTLLGAAGRGATDSVEGVMTNCIWGKEAPLGTGGNFGLFWQKPKGIQRFGASKEAVKDVHTILKDLEDECIPDRFISSMPTLLPPHLHILPEGNLEFDDGAGFSPQRVSDCNEGLDDRNHGNSSVDDQRGVSDTAVDGNVPIDWIKEEIYQNSDIKPDEELGAWQPTSYQGGGWDDIDTVPGLRSLDNVSSDATGFKCYDTSKNSKNEEVVMVETTGMFGSMCLFQVF